MPTSDSMTNPFKVRLISSVHPNDRVIFKVSPNLSIDGGVEYTQLAPVHLPGAIQVYKNTTPRNFTLLAPFVSRTPIEASENQNSLHLMKSWRYPYFGSSDFDIGSDQQQNTTEMLQNNGTGDATNAQIQGSNQMWQEAVMNATNMNNVDRLLARVREQTTTADAINMLGAPPDVLYLYAYSKEDSSGEGSTNKNINRIPVVLTNISYTYPDNVDYMPTIDGEPFPIKMEINITLVEAHSPREYEQFSLSQYKQGRLRNF